MMTREWHTFGICPHVPFKLREKHRKELLDIINPSRPETDVFLSAIEEGISHAKGVEILREKGKPATIRKNLRSTKKALNKVLESFDQLDDFSKYLLREVQDESSFPEMLEKICNYYEQVSKALDEADKLPRGGKLYQGHRRCLAYHVAAAISDILKLTPTLTHNEADYIKSPEIGIYARCLSIALKAAEFCNDNDHVNLLNLMKEGLNTLNSRVISDGLIEFRTGSF